MRWQTTAILAVVLVALGAFYYVYEVRMGPEREKSAGQKGRVFTAESADVVEVALRRPGEIVRLKREAEGWQMLEPVRSRADRGAVEETVTTLVTAKMDREIAAAPASPAEFGLDKPAAEATLTLKDGKQLGLRLGGKNPTGVWVYAQQRDKPNVFVVADGVLRDATRPVADFRDKSVLAFERKDVAAVDIVLAEGTLAVEAADGKWRLTRPARLAADGDTVAELLDKLAAARVKEFVAESPRSLREFGLERPVRVLIHTGKDKERATKSLAIGRVDPAKKGVYAMRPGQPSVFLLPEEIWTLLPKNLAAIRDKTVVAFDRDKVTRIEIQSPRGAVTLQKENERWRITAPEALPADQTEAGAVLFGLQQLRAQAFLSEDASGIPRYLVKPEVRLTLGEAGGGPVTLLLAPSPERRGGQPSAYAAVAGRGPVVLVDAKALSEIGRSVTDLRDRTLLSGLEPKEIARVQVNAGGKRVLLERRGEADWRVLEPSKGAARSSKVEDLLYTLRSLRWKEIAAPAGAEPAPYGLDAPTFEVALYRADGTEIATVQVGRRETERAWVRTKSAPTVYTVDPKQLGPLPKVPDDLQG